VPKIIFIIPGAEIPLF